MPVPRSDIEVQVDDPEERVVFRYAGDRVAEMLWEEERAMGEPQLGGDWLVYDVEDVQHRIDDVPRDNHQAAIEKALDWLENQL